MGDSLLLVLFVIPVAAVAVGLLFYFRRKVAPEELERRRRLAVNSNGRMRDAVVIDVQDSVLQYTYEVRGVTYTASQDLKGLSSAPEDPALLLGVGVVKYLPKDPANSIMVCETWSGLRGGPQNVLTDHTQKASEG